MSNDSVSVEKVRLLPGDIEKVSSSEHAISNSIGVSNVIILFIIKITNREYIYCIVVTSYTL